MYNLETYSILVDVDDLVSHACVMLDFLVAIRHRLVVGVLDAALDVAKEQSLTPFDVPLSRWVPWLD